MQQKLNKVIRKVVHPIWMNHFCEEENEDYSPELYSFQVKLSKLICAPNISILILKDPEISKLSIVKLYTVSSVPDVPKSE
jgi:hypothetical protein